MATYTIPQHLATMAAARRVIPFIGAGFSAALGLPSWEALLSQLAEDVEDALSFDDVKRLCNSDYLQMAEYYYLKCDRSIGPIRHSIANQLRTANDPVLSGAHVELVNLGSQQIYTTNYDEAIEQTFRALHRPYYFVALPKHVATIDGRRTQVVKYHGDLRHDHTLVLTESSYYSRLDFESPMDLKFRSDILGKSVLFIGYSFRDINIRIIWFKLMRMMKDIHPDDRPSSYIVSFGANPVLQSLYNEVGIQTIVLDPEARCDSPDKKSRLLADFMFELSQAACRDNVIPGDTEAPFVSAALLDRVAERIDELSTRNRFYQSPIRFNEDFRIAATRRIPPQFNIRVADLIRRIAGLKMGAINLAFVDFASSYIEQCGPSSDASYLLIRALCAETTYDHVIQRERPWNRIWTAELRPENCARILDSFKSELTHHESREDIDTDLAYLLDPVVRMARGGLVPPEHPQLENQARELQQAAGRLYEAAENYEPDPGGPPDVTAIIAEIEERIAQSPSEESQSDDIPF